MKKRLLIAITVVAMLAASPAHAITATIKRENPLLVQTAYLKGTPVLTPINARGMTFDGLNVWVAFGDAGQVLRWDDASNKLMGTLTYSGTPTPFPNQLVFDGTYVWVFMMNGNKVYKYASNGALQANFPISLNGSATWGAAFDGDFIWVSTDYAGGALERINVSTRAITAFNVGFQGAVGFDGRDLWVAVTGGGTAKVDGQTGAVIVRDASPGPSSVGGVTFDGQSVWITSNDEDVVRKWDPTTNTVLATVTTYDGPRNTAFDGTYLWVVCKYASTIVKIDVRTDQIADTILLPAGSKPYNISFDGNYMWVSDDNGKMYKYLVRFN
jgi:hypothetical protein